MTFLVIFFLCTSALIAVVLFIGVFDGSVITIFFLPFKSLQDS